MLVGGPCEYDLFLIGNNSADEKTIIVIKTKRYLCSQHSYNPCFQVRIAEEFRIITASIIVRAPKSILPENAHEWESDLGICSLVGTIFVWISGKGVKTKRLWHVFNSPLGVVGLNAMKLGLLSQGPIRWWSWKELWEATTGWWQSSGFLLRYWFYLLLMSTAERSLSHKVFKAA